MPRYIIIKVMKTRESENPWKHSEKRVEIIQNVFFDHKGTAKKLTNITIRKATNTSGK